MTFEQARTKFEDMIAGELIKEDMRREKADEVWEAIEEETEETMIWSLHELKRDIIDGVKGKCDLDV